MESDRPAFFCNLGFGGMGRRWVYVGLRRSNIARKLVSNPVFVVHGALAFGNSGSGRLFLQTGSAFAARQVLTLLNVPVYFEGLFISLPGVTVEVAEQCSGIRSAIALMILTTVAGYMYLSSNWHRFVFMLAVVPVTIFKNGLRVVTLAMLGAYVDMSYLTDSFVHSSGGKPFMVLGIALMLPVLWGLGRSERRRQQKSQTTDKAPEIVSVRS
jgi:exosortase/archaeosortase family protein